MSVRDLSQQGADPAEIRADVCVVGAGIAGLLMAARLARAGRKVVVLESGGRRSAPATDALNEVEDVLGTYAGALQGRTRALGGTSSLWGGRMLPMRQSDMDERPHVGVPAWPITAAELAPYGAEVERLFGVDDHSFEAGFLAEIGGPDPFPRDDPDFAARWPKWSSFRRCNLSVLLAKEIEQANGMEIWLGATVNEFVLDREAGRVLGVRAVDPSGRRLTVTAEQLVLAAGTIETTRLLLWLDAEADGRALGRCESLGRYFQDHVSTTLGRLRAADRASATRLFGFHFVGATRRNLHLEIEPAAQRQDRVGAAFAQIVLEPSEASALDTIKNLLRGLQRRRLDLPPARAMRLVSQLPDLARMAAWRYGERRLYLARGTELLVSVLVEQLPHSDNRITLSKRRDGTGMPRARLEWRTTPDDVRAFASTARRLDAYWERAGFAATCPIEWFPGATDEGRILAAKGLDVFHPSGTARMGSDPRTSVVDRDLRCHAIPNLWVASAAAFPSAGAANPTYTIMQLALRAADAIEAETASRPGRLAA